MEKKILELFTKHHSLKFSQIEKSLSLRSNKLAYHLNNLLKKNILIKHNQTYSLSDTSEYLIPFLSEKTTALPVVLVHIGDNKNTLLIKRAKRPYLGKLSLPGGRLLNGESIFVAAKRIVKEKCNLDIHPISITSITHEHIKKNNSLLHSFLLILVKAKPSSKSITQLTSIRKNRNQIIPSDFKLISSEITNPISVPTIFSKEP